MSRKLKPTIPLPHGLKFTEWAALVVEALSKYGVQNPVSEDQWAEWANSLLYNPELATIPSPYGFNSWLDWASRVTEATL
jgi:hypothetical protein